MANVDIDRDEKIADMLREGIQNRDIARILAVGHSEITRVRKELGLAGQTGGPRAIDLPPPHIDRKAEPKEVATQVNCIVAGAEIGARECIARQCEQHCFCPKASFAINAMTPLVLPGTRLEDQLASCRAVARSVLMKPFEERFLGPALQAFRGEEVEQPLIAGELPTPPTHEPPPAPAPPAEEKKMAAQGSGALESITDDQLRAKFDAAPTIAYLRADIGCGYNVLRARLGALGLTKPRGGDRRSDAAHKDSAPKNVYDVAAKYLKKKAKPEISAGHQALMMFDSARHVVIDGKVVKSNLPPGQMPPMVPPDRYVAPNVDIVELLQQQRAHHAHHMARIDKALAALKE